MFQPIGIRCPAMFTSSDSSVLLFADNLIFTEDEFDHLKDCPSCLQQWNDYVVELMRVNPAA